jgi:hypothetical protein
MEDRDYAWYPRSTGSLVRLASLKKKDEEMKDDSGNSNALQMDRKGRRPGNDIRPQIKSAAGN